MQLCDGDSIFPLCFFESENECLCGHFKYCNSTDSLKYLLNFDHVIQDVEVQNAGNGGGIYAVVHKTGLIPSVIPSYCNIDFRDKFG